MAAARAMKGTPFRDQGRLPGVGLDCGGVVVVSAHQVGIAPEFDFTAYSKFPRPKMVREILCANLDVVQGGMAAARSGDVGLIDEGGYAVHMGIFAAADLDRPIAARFADVCNFSTGQPPVGAAQMCFIHASARDGCVVEHRVDDAFARSLRGVFRFREVES